MQLMKLEVILNVATLGYSVLWLEPHAVVAGAALRRLLTKTQEPVMHVLQVEG